MKPIFSRGPSLQIRLIQAVLVALGIIIADSRLGTLSQIRTYMDTAVSPFYFVSNAPRELLDGVSQTLASRDQLELENRALRQELLLKNSELLMLDNTNRRTRVCASCWVPRCVRMSRKW